MTCCRTSMPSLGSSVGGVGEIDGDGDGSFAATSFSASASRRRSTAGTFCPFSTRASYDCCLKSSFEFQRDSPGAWSYFCSCKTGS